MAMGRAPVRRRPAARGLGLRSAAYRPMTATPTKEAGPGAAAHDRRLDLLRRIAEAGGTITPHVNPQAKQGYEYVALGDGVEDDLQFLARRDYLEQRFFDRVSL